MPACDYLRARAQLSSSPAYVIAWLDVAGPVLPTDIVSSETQNPMDGLASYIDWMTASRYANPGAAQLHEAHTRDQPKDQGGQSGWGVKAIGIQARILYTYRASNAPFSWLPCIARAVPYERAHCFDACVGPSDVNVLMIVRGWGKTERWEKGGVCSQRRAQQDVTERQDTLRESGGTQDPVGI